MYQILGIILTQALLWYVLPFGGTAFYADYFVMGLNVVLLAAAYIMARGLIGSDDDTFVMASVRQGVEAPSGPIATAVGLIHVAIIIFLFATNEWWFGAAIWIAFAAVSSTYYSRAKRLLVPDTIKNAHTAIKMSDKVMAEIQEQQELSEVAEDVMKQLQIITDEFDREAAANKAKLDKEKEE